MTDAERYAVLIADCMKRLGSKRALERQLGIGRSALNHRLNNPHVIKREHLYAAEHLHGRLER